MILAELEIFTGMACSWLRRIVLIMAGAILVFGASRAEAQLVAPEKLRDLEFGVIIAGTNKTIPPESDSAAAFKVTIVLGLLSRIRATITPPLNGAVALPVSLCSTCGRIRAGVNSPVGATVFDPNSGVNFTLAALSTTYIWLGATASPTRSQKSGTYTGGTIVLVITGVL